MKFEMIITLACTTKVTIEAENQDEAFSKILDKSYDTFADVMKALEANKFNYAFHYSDLAEEGAPPYKIEVFADNDLDDVGGNL